MQKNQVGFPALRGSLQLLRTPAREDMISSPGLLGHPHAYVPSTTQILFKALVATAVAKKRKEGHRLIWGFGLYKIIWLFTFANCDSEMGCSHRRAANTDIWWEHLNMLDYVNCK